MWAAFDPDQNDQIEQAYLKWVFDPRVGSLTLVTNSYQYSINFSPNADSDLRQPHYQTNVTHTAPGPRDESGVSRLWFKSKVLHPSLPKVQN